MAVDDEGRGMVAGVNGMRSRTVGSATNALHDREEVRNGGRQRVSEHDGAHVTCAQARCEAGVRDVGHARYDRAQKGADEQNEAVRTCRDVGRMVPEDSEQHQRRQRQHVAAVDVGDVADDTAGTASHHQVGDEHHVTTLEHQEQVDGKVGALWGALYQQRELHPERVHDEAAADADERDAHVNSYHRRATRLHGVYAVVLLADIPRLARRLVVTGEQVRPGREAVGNCSTQATYK